MVIYIKCIFILMQLVLVSASIDENNGRPDLFEITSVQVNSGRCDPNHTKVVDERLISCISSEISNGNIDVALQQYTKLSKNFNDNDISNLISKIIQNTYDRIKTEDQLENVDNIINFLAGLTRSNEKAIGFIKLVEMMQKNEELDNLYLFVLAEKVEKLLNIAKTQSDPKLYFDLHNLKITLTEPINNMFNVWASKLRYNNDSTTESQIEEYSKKSPTVFNDNLHQLIHKYYGNNLKQIKNVIKFIQNLTDIAHRITGYSSLLKKMKCNSHTDSHELMILAYKVKELEGMNLKCLGYENKYSFLKYDLPESVRNLIWNGSSCTIRNKRWNEYVYSPYDSLVLNAESRYVFTWIPGIVDETGHYEFETSDNAKSFTIKSLKRNEYLYAADNIDSERRWVYTWRKNTKVSNGYWFIKPVDNVEYFSLQNTVYSEYLFAEGVENLKYDKDRRYVFTYKNGGRQLEGSMVAQDAWEITC